METLLRNYTEIFLLGFRCNTLYSYSSAAPTASIYKNVEKLQERLHIRCFLILEQLYYANASDL